MDCYICKKALLDSDEKVHINKDIARHRKCNPGIPKGLNGKEIKMEEQKVVVTPEEQVVVETPKVEEKKKRGRGRPRGSKNKPKGKKDEQKA